MSMGIRISKPDLKALASIKAVYERRDVVMSDENLRHDPDFNYSDFDEMFDQVIAEKTQRLSERFKKNTAHLVEWQAVSAFAKTAQMNDTDYDNFRFWCGEEMFSLEHWCGEWLRTGCVKTLKELKAEIANAKKERNGTL
jgi:hypothetical protein